MVRAPARLLGSRQGASRGTVNGGSDGAVTLVFDFQLGEYLVHTWSVGAG